MRPEGTALIIQSDFLHNTGQRTSPSNSCCGRNCCAPLFQMLLLQWLSTSETCLSQTEHITLFWKPSKTASQAQIIFVYKEKKERKWSPRRKSDAAQHLVRKIVLLMRITNSTWLVWYTPGSSSTALRPEQSRGKQNLCYRKWGYTP